jgi:hypothetical protein
VSQRGKFTVLNNIFPCCQNPQKREANQKHKEENNKQKYLFHTQKGLMSELV